MRNHVRRRARRDERGAAALEFALVMIPLLLILGGIVNFGVVFAQQLALDNAARQGARWGAVDGRTTSQIETETQTALDAMIAKQGTVAVVVTKPAGGGDPPCKGSTFGGNVKVTTTYTSTFIFPWLLPGIPTSVNLTGSGQFQCEFS